MASTVSTKKMAGAGEPWEEIRDNVVNPVLNKGQYVTGMRTELPSNWGDKKASFDFTLENNGTLDGQQKIRMIGNYLSWLNKNFKPYDSTYEWVITDYKTGVKDPAAFQDLTHVEATLQKKSGF